MSSTEPLRLPVLLFVSAEGLIKGYLIEQCVVHTVYNQLESVQGRRKVVPEGQYIHLHSFNLESKYNII